MTKGAKKAAKPVRKPVKTLKSEKSINSPSKLVKKEDNNLGDMILTGVDVLLDLVRKKKRITLNEAAKLTKYPKATIEDWANILEDEGLISIEYKFTKTYLVSSDAKDIKKETRKTVLKSALEKKKDKTQKSFVEVEQSPASIEASDVEIVEDIQKSEDSEEQRQEKPGFFQKLEERKQQKIADNERGRLQKEIERLSAEEEKLKKSIEELEKQHGNVVVNEEELKTDIKHIIEQEKNDIKEAEKKPEELNQKLISLRDTIKNQQDEIIELKKSNVNFSEEEKRLLNEVQKLQKKVSLVEGGKFKLKTRPLFHSIATHVSHSGLSKKYKKQINEMQTQINSLNEAQTDVQGSINKLHKENLSLKKYEQNLHAETTGFMKSEDRKLQGKLSYIKKKINLVEKKKMRVSRRPLLNVFASHLSSKAIHEKYQKELETLQRRHNSLNKVQKTLQGQIEKLGKDAVALKLRDSMLNSKIGNLKKPRSLYSEIHRDWAKYRQHQIKQAKEKLIEDRKQDLKRRAKELQQAKEKLTEKKAKMHQLAVAKTIKGAVQSELLKAKISPSSNQSIVYEKNAFQSSAHLVFGRKKQLFSGDKSKSIKAESYSELIEKANKELMEHGQLMDQAKVLPKHEPFAVQLIKELEQEEKRLHKKGLLSKTKIRTLRNKKRRVQEKIKRLHIERTVMNSDEFRNKNQSLNHVLDKINNLLMKK